jgi:hypothetical protein
VHIIQLPCVEGRREQVDTARGHCLFRMSPYLCLRAQAAHISAAWSCRQACPQPAPTAWSQRLQATGELWHMQITPANGQRRHMHAATAPCPALDGMMVIRGGPESVTKMWRGSGCIKKLSTLHM